MTDRETNTLAMHGLEEPFFQLCCCVSFLFWQEIGFCFTYYLCTQSTTIQLWCYVSFLVLAGNSFWCYVRTQCTIQLCVLLCQFFCCGGKVNFVQIPYSHDSFSKLSRTFSVKKLIQYKTYVQEYKLFLALYGSTTIQLQLFLKNIKNIV